MDGGLILCFSYCHPSLLSHWFWKNNEVDGIESDGWIDGLDMSCFLMQKNIQVWDSYTIQTCRVGGY